VRVALLVLAALIAATGGGAAPAADPRTNSIDLAEGVDVALVDGREIQLLVVAVAGDGWISLARRFLHDPEQWRLLAEANGGQPHLLRGRTYRVPWNLLRAGYRLLALRRLFPGDGPDGDAWVHRPSAAAVETYGEGLWQVALWFTGDGEHFVDLAEANGLAGPDIPAGAELRIPPELLVPGLRPQAKSEDSLLVYATDDRGSHAVYRLRKGEAIYSAIVVRYTGRIDPEEVNRVAKQVAVRSGIKDVTAIPVGAAVKVALDLLLPEHLPRTDPRRIEYELGLGEVAAVRKAVRARELAGVHVILDPGHGGRDRGAERNGVWESDYVFDVMARMKRRLEAETSAKVHPTVRDRDIGYRVLEQKTIRANGAEVIRTHPEHAPKGGSSTTVGVNLRWYLANSVYRKLIKGGTDPERVVFISLHADSLHPSLQGAMIYVPGERYRRGTYGSRGSSYRKFREAKEKPLVSIPRAHRIRDEGLSRQLAESILGVFRQKKLPIHPDRPIRDHIVRRRRAWVPAVLRGNEVPTKILFELANLRNGEDARRLQDPAYRQRLADALVEALTAYYRD
jgi:N-acetylmuramoyl-L-alanine amidase